LCSINVDRGFYGYLAEKQALIFFMIFLKGEYYKFIDEINHFKKIMKTNR